jgi:hypothetical protein
VRAMAAVLNVDVPLLCTALAANSERRYGPGRRHWSTNHAQFGVLGAVCDLSHRRVLGSVFPV